MSRIRLILNCLGLTAAFLTASASRPEGIIISLSTRQRTLRLRHLKSGKITPSIVPHAFFLLLPPASSHCGTLGVTSSRAERKQQRFIAMDGGAVVVTTLLWHAAVLRVPLPLPLYVSGPGLPPRHRLCAHTCACAHRGAHFVTDTRARAFAREPMLTRVAGDINVTLSPCFMSGAAQRSVKIKRQREGGRGWKIENIPQTTSWPEFDLRVSVAVLQRNATANFLV